MTLSGWLDIVLVVVVLVAASSGLRQGAFASALAFLGVVLGAVAGILVVPHVLTRMESEGVVRLLVGVGVIVGLVVIGEIAGMVLGRAVRQSIHSPTARTVDSIVGAALQAGAVLVAGWLLAIPLATSSQPDVASAVRGSRILAGVDAVAPDWLRRVPDEFTALLDTSGLPEVLGPFARVPGAEVDPPDVTLATSPVVDQARPSIVRVNGVAPSCQRALEGSGFVVGEDRVVTNAHVVAGTSSVSVDTLDGRLEATVVLFDPAVDIAVLEVPRLGLPSLPFAPGPASSGQSAIVAGFPGGGPFVAGAARIRDVVRLQGRDIYATGQIDREVYTLRGTVQQGNSGGPLLDDGGRVLGLVFGAATGDEETGFALTAKEIAPHLAQGLAATVPAATGSCVA